MTEKAIEDLTTELLFWRRCWKDAQREANQLRRDIVKKEEEARDLYLQFGVEGPTSTRWLESEELTEDERYKEAYGYAITSPFLNIVTRYCGPARKDD